MTNQKSKNKNNSHALTAHLLLIAVTLVWGATFPLVKSALLDISPLLFNLLRMTLAFLILAALNGRSLRGLSRSDLRFGAVAGLFLGLGYQFQTAGLARTSASKSAFITGLVVVFVPLLGMIPHVRVAGAVKPGLYTFIGAFAAFAGLVLLTTPPGSGTALLAGLGLGEWLTLACAVAFAAHLLTLSHAATNVSARRLGTLQIGFAAFVLLITLPLGGHPAFHLTSRAILALAVTAILATAAAFTIQSWAQQHLPASHTALIFTLEPVFAWLTSLIFLHEHLGARALCGAALILAGILAAEFGPTLRQSRVS
ncbi:DMT family transporter [Granulicella mallensis]|uniref:Drug/metabolite transporter (DMT)-like permease n=1 Tax=Granulicella mallensis TaxID=940614 RepID=A0A7W7ZT49_9BACT|nr:DMT family transporter [Granulicella mallensis]MBB5065685.1 drug/metabolite transporter (DMT)-like permease [Granulicella mallensis]